MKSHKIVPASLIFILSLVAPSLGAEPSQLWTNSLGMKFVPVPGTKVKFSIWLTRNQDFQAFASASGRKWENKFRPGPDYPVTSVTWREAKAFCDWLTKKERGDGTIPATQEYRLPTDWEWSKSVVWDDDERQTPQQRQKKPCNEYPWGKEWPPPHGVANLAPSVGVDDVKGTSPVGNFPPSRFGLYDMAGNAAQWCEDFYDGKGGDKVSRGSGFAAGSSSMALSSRRTPAPLDEPNVRIGFRCVLAEEESAMHMAVTGPADLHALTTPTPGAQTSRNTQPPPVATPQPAVETKPGQDTSPVRTLTQQAPNAMEWALAPLDQSVPAGVRQNLKLLREDLLDEAKASPSAAPETYATGRQLCDALVTVLDERDATLVKAGYRAAQADANTEVTSQALEARRNHLMSWPQYAREKDQAAEIFRQQTNKAALTKELPKVEWSNRTTLLRKSLDALYSKYREAIRQNDAAMKPGASGTKGSSERSTPKEAQAPESGRTDSKANRIIIPKVIFRQATVDEALSYLRRVGGRLDPDKIGFTITLVAAEKTKDTKVDLDLKQVPFAEAVKQLAIAADLEMTRDGDAFILRSR